MEQHKDSASLPVVDGKVCSSLRQRSFPREYILPSVHMTAQTIDDHGLGH